MAAKIDNIFVSDWHPQPAILSKSFLSNILMTNNFTDHPRLRLFVTHAGYETMFQKTLESRSDSRVNSTFLR